jgi:peroxiredoxin family protein
VPCDSDRLVLVHISRGTDIHTLTAYRTKHCNKPTGAAHYEHEYNAFNSNVNVYACGMGDDTYTMQKDDYCDVYSMDEHEITGLVGHECTDAMRALV